MVELTLEAHHGRQIVIDLCHPCQSFWFDTRESVSLTPGSTLSLFRVIGESVSPPVPSRADWRNARAAAPGCDQPRTCSARRDSGTCAVLTITAGSPVSS